MKRTQPAALALLVLGLVASSPALAAGPVFDPLSYGAKGDGTTKDTAAIQSAIDACAGVTNGTVRLHDGTYLTGMITLKSNVHFTIDSTATLKGTQDDSDYPVVSPNVTNGQLFLCQHALVYADGATNLTLDGTGTIDGNGGASQWGNGVPEGKRPMGIFFAGCDTVTISGLTVNDLAMWGIVNMQTNHLTLQNLTVHTPFGPTRDGIDVVDCHHVLVQGCRVDSEDDSICLKSGSSWGCYDVVVNDNHVLHSSVANGLKLGTASVGEFRDIRFTNNIVDDVAKAAMAVESVDGAAIHNVVFQGITLTGCGTGIFVLLGKRGNPPSVGSIDEIQFRDVTGSGMVDLWGSALSGTIVDGVTYSITNLTFDNVNLAYHGGLTTVPADPPEYAGQYPDPNLWGHVPAAGLWFRHVQGVTFTHSKITLDHKDARPVIGEDDVTGFAGP